MNKKNTLFILTIFILILTISSVTAYNHTTTTTNTTDNDNQTISTLLHNIKGKYSNNTDNNLTLITIYNNTTQENTDKNETEKLDKSRPIYFAMDHVNGNDKEIRDTIINRLKKEGFNVVSAEIGPNKMSQDTLTLYEQNVSNAIIFHLFNGVDPSTIRELGTNGNDNRGRIVRSNGNDVVLAWFYDSVDCVNDNGTGVNYVYGSETGPSLQNPKQYMKDNDIIAICTSSDMGKHKETADYTGEKTVDEFIKLFE